MDLRISCRGREPVTSWTSAFGQLVFVAIVLLSLQSGHAWGQIGLTVEEVQQFAQLLPPDDYRDKDISKQFGVNSQPIVFPDKPEKPMPHILSRDGKIIGVCDASALKGSDIEWYLRKFTRVSKKKTRTEPKWQNRVDLLALFPPLGDGSEAVLPILKTLYWVDTYRVKPGGAAEFLYSSPFSKVVGQRTVENKYVRTAVVLENTNMDLYALVSIYYARSNFIGVPSDYVSHEILLADSSLFWPYMLEMTRGKNSPAVACAYEPMLNLQFDRRDLPPVHTWRTATVLLAATDRSSLPMEDVISLYEKPSKELPELRWQWLELASKKLRSANATAIERRTKLMAELGGISEIRALEPLLTGNQLMQRSAKTAIRAIATRHTLADLPDDDDRIEKWRMWIEDHGPPSE